MPSALIAYHGTLGLEHDSLVLTEALRATACTPGAAHRLALPDAPAWAGALPADVADALLALAPSDCLVLLEHVHANPSLPGRARRPPARLAHAAALTDNTASPAARARVGVGGCNH